MPVWATISLGVQPDGGLVVLQHQKFNRRLPPTPDEDDPQGWLKIVQPVQHEEVPQNFPRSLEDLEDLEIFILQQIHLEPPTDPEMIETYLEILCDLRELMRRQQARRRSNQMQSSPWQALLSGVGTTIRTVIVGGLICNLAELVFSRREDDE
jgi:hypothetical protein